MNAIIMKDTKVKDINLFQNITVEIDPFAIKVEEQFIACLMEYSSAILSYKAKIDEMEKLVEEK